jgi:hypothetical protein
MAPVLAAAVNAAYVATVIECRAAKADQQE